MKLINLDETSFWQHGLLATLSPSQREWLSERLQLRSFPPRTTIYQPSDPAEGLYFVLAGKVKVEATSGKGEWLIKNIFANGDFFGSKGLLGKPCRGEFARTLRNDATLVLMHNAELTRLMEVNFEFSEELFVMIGSELRFMEERMADLTGLSARERFMKFVLRMTERFGSQEGEGWSFNSQLTQEEIGTYIGTGRQTVTEILNEFKSQGVLQYSWGRFFINEIEALRAV